MFRHVVMFRWTPDSSPSARQSAIDALKIFGSDVADFASLTVAGDAGVSEGNFDAVVVVDLADAEAYLRYAGDPRHIAVLTDHVRPILAERAAVQYHLT
jgi:hypothetical protein